MACCAATLGTNNATRVINQLQLSTESVKALMGEDLTEEELLKASTDGVLDVGPHAGNLAFPDACPLPAMADANSSESAWCWSRGLVHGS